MRKDFETFIGDNFSELNLGCPQTWKLFVWKVGTGGDVGGCCCQRYGLTDPYLNVGYFCNKGFTVYTQTWCACCPFPEKSSPRACGKRFILRKRLSSDSERVHSTRQTIVHSPLLFSFYNKPFSDPNVDDVVVLLFALTRGGYSVEVGGGAA